MKNSNLILGITDSLDCGATITKNNKILCSINEERINRKKNCHGFPKEAILSVLKEGKIKVVDFRKTRLNLSGMKTKSITQPKVQETKSQILIKCFLRNNNEKKLLNCPDQEKIEVLSEINRRFGMPLYVPFVA